MRHISHLANLLKIKKSTMGKHNKSSENGHDACPKWERCLPNMGKHLAPVGQILRQAVAQNVMMTDRAFEIKRPALPEEERQGNLCQKIRSLL